MKVKVLISFAGQICGGRGQTLDIPDGSEVLKDLLKVGYIEEIRKPQTRKKTKIGSEKALRMSEVSVENLMEYLREEEESELLSSILSAGKQYVLQFTGLSEKEANEKEIFHSPYWLSARICTIKEA